MKTSIKNLIATSLTAIALSTTCFTTNALAAEKEIETVSSPKNVKRVSVKGNVEITLVQRNTEGISYAEDNNGTARITQQGDILRITSTERGITRLIVYVKDIFRIEASEDAVVKTQGKLITRYLQVFLKGNAHADLNTSTEGLYTVINDHADLKLSGSTDKHTLVMGKTPKLTMDKFAALKTNISSIEITSIEKEIASIK